MYVVITIGVIITTIQIVIIKIKFWDVIDTSTSYTYTIKQNVKHSNEYSHANIVTSFLNLILKEVETNG